MATRWLGPPCILDPRQEVHRAGPGGEYRTGTGLLRRVGRGSAAGHHLEAAQAYQDIQEDEEAVSSADYPERQIARSCTSLMAPWTRSSSAVGICKSAAGLRNQHELDAVIEELSALLPKDKLRRILRAGAPAAPFLGSQKLGNSRKSKSSGCALPKKPSATSHASKPWLN